MVRSIGFGVALLLLAACGGSSGGGMDDGGGCVLLTAAAPLRMPGASSAMELPPLQVTLEVRFVTLSDTFFDSLGINFNQGLDPDVDPLPTGGSNGNGTSFGTTADLIGGLSSGALPLVPQGQTGIQVLPIIHPSFVSPTQGMFISTNLPGSTCIEFGAGTTFGLDGLNPVPGGQELPPILGGTQPALRAAFLDDIEVSLILNAIQTDGTSELLAAPQVTVRDGQFATVQVATETPMITDMPAAWNGRFAAMNNAIGQVQT